MGLRPDGEKPATVLRLIYICGWLPALVGAYALGGRPGAPRVLSGAGREGVLASAALLFTLAILGAGYALALRRPPSRTELLVAAAGSVLAALAMPLLFSADVYAYAYYGDLVLHGRNPYEHGAAPAGDALATAARAAWNGHVPPRCVYGPVAIGIAVIADSLGTTGSELARGLAGAVPSAPGAVAAQIFAGRAVAVIAYGLAVRFVLRLTDDARARAALVLHPSVLWSVAEGHNDAAMLACACAGLAAMRGRAALLVAAALVKGVGVFAFGTIAGARARCAAVATVVAGYLPLAAAAASSVAASIGLPGGPRSSSAPPNLAVMDGDAAWQSPLGLVAHQIGRVPAVICALVTFGVAVRLTRNVAPAERTAALALAAWFMLPNAYPWYALWIVPLAARNVSSLWSRALLAAALCAPFRAVLDAVFPAADRPGAGGVFHLPLIALEFVPPLVLLTWHRIRARQAVVRAILIVAIVANPLAASAQGGPSTPSAPPAATLPPGPASPATSTPPQPTASPALAAPAQPGSASPAMPSPAQQTTATPAVSTPAPAAQAAPATPVATTTPLPAPPTPVPPALGPPVTRPQQGPTQAPVPAPTPNPFGYVITPPAVPTTSPDGPHIFEVALNDRRIHAGGPLIVRVLTSANVVGVEARALGRFIPIPENRPGMFALAYTMPDTIPFWLLNRNYNIVIAAATADGRQTSVSFPMLLTR